MSAPRIAGRLAALLCCVVALAPFVPAVAAAGTLTDGPPAVVQPGPEPAPSAPTPPAPGIPPDRADPAQPHDPGAGEVSPAPPGPTPGMEPRVTPGSPKVTAPVATNVLLRDGHLDIATRLDGGRLRTELVLEAPGAPPVRHQPGRATLFVADRARATVPADPDFRFLGPPGAPLWVLPQTQDPELLWVGWNTERIPPGTLPGPLRWTLRSVDGPGSFALFTTDQFGRPRPLLVGGGSPNRMDVPLGTHAHGNWAFGAAGTYTLTIDVEADGAAGEQVTLRFQVGTDTGEGPPPTTTTLPGPTGPPTPTSPDGTRPAAAGPAGTRTLARTGPAGAATTVALGLVCLAGGSVLHRRARHLRRTTRR